MSERCTVTSGVSDAKDACPKNVPVAISVALDKLDVAAPGTVVPVPAFDLEIVAAAAVFHGPFRMYVQRNTKSGKVRMIVRYGGAEYAKAAQTTALKFLEHPEFKKALRTLRATDALEAVKRFEEQRDAAVAQAQSSYMGSLNSIVA